MLPVSRSTPTVVVAYYANSALHKHDGWCSARLNDNALPLQAGSGRTSVGGHWDRGWHTEASVLTDHCCSIAPFMATQTIYLLHDHK